MADVVTLPNCSRHRSTDNRGTSADPAEQAFAAYTAAALRAQATHDIRDGRAAGLAWSRFLALFEGEQ